MLAIRNKKLLLELELNALPQSVRFHPGDDKARQICAQSLV